jgi:hypothetical protein
VVGCCEHGKGTFSSIKGDNFLTSWATASFSELVSKLGIPVSEPSTSVHPFTQTAGSGGGGGIYNCVIINLCYGGINFLKWSVN